MAELRVSATSLLSMFLFCVFPGAISQSSDGSQYPPYPPFNPSIAVIIAVLVAAFFFMAFFSIYIRHCTEPLPSPSTAAVDRRSSAAAAASRGLDPAVVATFPTFVYSDVKGHKIGKGALECAVCLNEFEDDETLRLIPKCDHVFHPDCIDAWLASHVTCPVCRANLVPQPGEPASSITELESHPEADHEVDGGGSDLESGRLQPEASDQNPIDAAEDSTKANNSGNLVIGSGDRRLNRNRTRGSSRSLRRSRWTIFPRSHSSGHSLVQPGEDTERYTLRLPVEVRKRMVDRQLNRAMSMVVLPRGGSTRVGQDDSIGRGKYVRRASSRFDRWASRSDRWFFGIRTPQLFSRAASMRSPRVAAVVEDAGSKTESGETSRPPV